MKTVFVGLCGIAFASCAVVHAQTLAQREFQSFHDGEFARLADEVGEMCQTNFATDIDWATFRDEDYGNYGIADRCEEGVRPLITVCRSEIGRSRVQERLSGFVCRRGDTASAELDGQTLRITVPLEGLTPYNTFADFYDETL